MTEERWQLFTEKELCMILDGLRYMQWAYDTAGLVTEIENEFGRRAEEKENGEQI